MYISLRFLPPPPSFLCGNLMMVWKKQNMWFTYNMQIYSCIRQWFEWLFVYSWKHKGWRPSDYSCTCLSVSYFYKPVHYCCSCWAELNLIDINFLSVSGLAKLEGEMIDCDYDEISKDICTKYQLTGIVVHSGQASGGHYYSYILHR